MTALEKVRKIRESYLTHDSFYKATNVFVMGEDEAVALLTDEPSKTAEEIVREIRKIRVRDVCINCGYEEGVHHYETLQCPGDDPNSMKGGRLWRGTTYQTRSVPLLSANDAIRLIQSALTAHAKAAVEEAAERYCEACGSCAGVKDPDCKPRAAILGREAGKPGNDQTCEYCRGTGVISDSIALTKPCPMCSTKQSALKGEEAPHE